MRRKNLEEEMRRKNLEEEMRIKLYEEMIRKRDEYFAEIYTPEELKINPADYDDFEVEDDPIQKKKIEPAVDTNLQYSETKDNQVIGKEMKEYLKNLPPISLLDTHNSWPKPITSSTSMSGYYWNKKLQSLKKTYDLKHLSPLFVVEHHLENILISPTQTKVNRNFQGTRIAENAKQGIFSDYYKFNENNHFVWTNQTVMNENITDLDTKIVHNLYMGNFNYTHCNLADPDKSFELRGKGRLGFGLYAKHYIPKSSFCLIFVNYF